MKSKQKPAADKPEKQIFFDPRRTRLYILSVILFGLLLVYAYVKIFYPDFLVYLRYSLFSFQLRFIYITNRIFAVLICINFAKLAVWLALSRRSKIKPESGPKPKVTVVIPAYNEERVIVRTVEAVLASDYRNFEVIVVDDGSADRTAALVTGAFAGDKRVRLIAKPNGGKYSALNAGISAAHGSLLLLLDADTVVAKDALSRLVPHFSDARVAAVSGNTRVGNVVNIITRCQRIEYIRDFNLIKNGMSRAGCMAVVPGALGAWRKSAVEAVGGFSSATLGEDRDITMALIRAGYKLDFEPSAFSETEAPQTLRDFMKQRFRWTYATIQCIHKYIGSLFNPRVPAMGFLLMPDLLIFQVVVPVVTMIGFISNLLCYRRYEFILITVTFAASLLFEAALFLLSLTITHEKCTASDVLCIIPQRMIYGVVCTYILYKAIVVAWIGGRVRWNKVNRVGVTGEKPFINSADEKNISVR
jgi:cellulose synthase/poly-beta-1,6-N-acetylglucosamine synthase-like glycosyltransferase